MPRVHFNQTSFTSGELSPKMLGRTDLDQYRAGLALCVNYVLQPFGGVSRRPGTRFVGEAKTDNQPVKLARFEFNDQQAYILEFGAQYIRFFTQHARLLDGQSNILEVTTPYAAEDVKDLQFAQSADVLYIVHQKHPPAKLSRTSNTEWTYAAITFTAPPTEWTGTNYPGTVTLYEQRSWWGGTPNEPQTVWASRSGLFEDLTMGNQDADDAMKYTIASNEVNPILWMISASNLTIGTWGGEFTVRSGTTNQPIAPDSIRVVRESTYGAVRVPPIPIGSAILFVQRGGRRVRELVYNLEEDHLVAPDLTLLADHVTYPSIKEMKHAQDPFNLIWTLRTDGVLVCLTYERREGVVGWHRHFLGGNESKVHSIEVIPDAQQDELWLAVERTINGVKKQYIEYLDQPFDAERQFNERFPTPLAGNTVSQIFTALGESVSPLAEEGVVVHPISDALNRAFFADSGIMYQGDPVTQLSNLQHLEGEIVSILADGSVHKPQFVANGAITLERPASHISVGLPYLAFIQTLPLEFQGPEGSAVGAERNIPRIWLHVHETAGLEYSTDANYFAIMATRSPRWNMDEAPLVISGVRQIDLADPYARQSAVIIAHFEPLPSTVLSLTSRQVVNWG